MPSRLREVFWVCFMLGCTAFGGPAAHIALLQREVVERRKWLSADAFAEMLGLTNLLPGPNSTEMIIHTGYHWAGWAGLIVAGVSFIVPAAGITLGLVWFHTAYGKLPAVEPWLWGIAPVAVGIVLAGIYRLSRSTLYNSPRILIALVAAGLVAVGLPEAPVLLGLAAVWATAACLPRFRPPYNRSLIALLGTAGASTYVAPTLPTLFGIFLKIGGTLYGSGYLLVAYLNEELVARRGWLSPVDLLDAVAAGQITPGPLFATATWIGYKLLGLPGALAATAGIFLPAFVLIAVLAPHLPRLLQNRWFQQFLHYVAASAIGVLAVTIVQLAWPLHHQPLRLALALLCGAVLLWRTKLNPAWLVLAAVLTGGLLHLSGLWA